MYRRTSQIRAANDEEPTLDPYRDPDLEPTSGRVEIVGASDEYSGIATLDSTQPARSLSGVFAGVVEVPRLGPIDIDMAALQALMADCERI